MVEKIKGVFTAPVRGWIYGVSAAAVPVCIYAGWMEPEAAPLALALILALLKVTPDAE